MTRWDVAAAVFLLTYNLALAAAFLWEGAALVPRGAEVGTPDISRPLLGLL